MLLISPVPRKRPQLPGFAPSLRPMGFCAGEYSRGLAPLACRRRFHPLGEIQVASMNATESLMAVLDILICAPDGLCSNCARYPLTYLTSPTP